MTLAVVLIAVVAAILIWYVMKYKGSYDVIVTTVINKPPQEVFAKVADLRSWPQWSPWLQHEPECKLEYSTDPHVNEVGGYYSWHGSKVGIGKMTQKEMDAPNSIVQQIDFVKPFKAINKVTWKFEKEGEGTKVSWGLAGKMPFWLRFMTPMMVDFIEKDYGCGLQMLKQELDADAPRINIDFHGVSERPAIRCVKHDYAGPMQEMAEVMKQHYPKMVEAAKDSDGKLPDMPLAIYNKMDEKGNKVDVTLGVPTTNQESGGYGIYDVAGGRYAKTTLRGNYDMLGHAWYSAFSNARMNKLKFDKGRKPYEVYENDPHEISDTNDLETSIYIPVKG